MDKRKLYKIECSAVSGDVHAMHMIAAVYEGNGNIDQALSWLNIAADKGYIPAYNELSRLYEELGESSKAGEWRKKAADASFYAVMHESGLRFEMIGNRKKALSLFIKAADGGNIPAQFDAGRILSKSDSEEDRERAKDYLIKASSQDFTPARKLLLGGEEASPPEALIDDLFTPIPDDPKDHLPF